MRIQSISFVSFWTVFAKALWQVRAVLLCLLAILAIDIGAVVIVSSCPAKAAREVVGWFFGNGSGIQDLAWPQMVCCIMSATFGYIFLGILLAAAVRAFGEAARK